jgi:predicted ester cyclase
MSVEENKTLIYKIYDEYNKGNYDIYDECFANDFLSYRWDGNVLDKKAYKQMLLGFKEMFPGIQRTIQDIIVTEDRAALYFTWTGKDNYTSRGHTPTGKLLKVNELYFIRFKNGKVSEYRQYGDAYGMAVQLGVYVEANKVNK